MEKDEKMTFIIPENLAKKLRKESAKTMKSMNLIIKELIRDNIK